MTRPIPLLRPALPSDAPAIADIFLAARAAMTYLPRLHSDEDTRAFIAHVVASQTVLVAVTQSAPDDIAGFAAINDHDDELSDETDKNTHLDHLYIDPLTQGQGIGTHLLNAVKTLRPRGFALWCFQQNHGAQRFYERHSLTLAKKTDGRDNEENLPDMLYVWAP
ncbi:MAG: GNAT family N-acetyltransferase [Parvibaculum sp.]|nr:GNAT family N-acetyltransferase [Parvibaculum sp.]